MTSLRQTVVSLLPEPLKSPIRPLFHAAQRWLSPGPTFDKPSTIELGTFDGFEIAYRRGTADEEVLKESFSHDIFYSGVPEYKPAPDHVILDIGGHIGTFSLLSSGKVERGKVYAIEACKDTYNLLRINIALNHRANISAHRLAISDKNGTATLFYDHGNWGNTLVKELSQQGETVETCTLADFLERNRIEKCHFMKLNCEGAEFPILLSTPSAVLARFEVILALYHCDLWMKDTEQALIRHLDSSGFECAVRNQTDQRGWIVATNRARPLPL